VLYGHPDRVEEGASGSDIYGWVHVPPNAAAVDLVHEEHGTLTLEKPGVYEIRRQAEWNFGSMVPVVD